MDNINDSIQATTVFDTEVRGPPEPDAFACYLIAPKSCQQAARHLRRLISLDGCHTNSASGFILLVCVSFDANTNIVPLTWVLVVRETKKSWRWFLKHLNKTYPSWLGCSKLSVLTDRQTGLLKAIASGLPNATHYYCIQHVKVNVARELGAQQRPCFRTLRTRSIRRPLRGGLSSFIRVTQS